MSRIVDRSENHVGSALFAESEDSMAFIDDTDDEGIDDDNEKKKLIDEQHQEQVGWFYFINLDGRMVVVSAFRSKQRVRVRSPERSKQ